MGKTSIEWTDASWNPVVGCTEVSPGCANCYAARLASTRLKNLPDYKGLAAKLKSEIQFPNCHPHGIPEGKVQPRWTGETRLLRDRLEEPLHWRTPRRIFVCDMGDLFHETMDKPDIWPIFEVMQRCPQHTFQVLTKRADRMRAFVNAWCADRPMLPNVWLGVSVENQHFANERIPLLLETPAAVRFLSCEPLLGDIDLLKADARAHALCGYYSSETKENRPLGLLHWVICGGESGSGARPMHPDWARSLRDQCVAAGVPFLFKQWGEWSFDGKWFRKLTENRIRYFEPHTEDGNWLMYRVGKKAAGRLLDGREWNEFPR